MQQIKLRPYQIEALDTIDESFKTKKIALLSAATGAGKTLIVCRLINKYYKDTERTFLVLAHKKELLEQFYSTLKKHTAIPVSDISFCCSGITNKYDFSKRIILASVQTLINKADEFKGADLVVIDETHRISHNDESQYQQLLSTLREHKPNHRALGVTATTYRLGHGLIYGDKCRPGRTNFFPELTYKVSYKQLCKDGYLMPLTGMIGASEGVLTELNGVKLSGGEYVMSAAGHMLGQHVESAVEAYKKYATEHNKIAILACTIEHAEKLQKAFNDAGFPCNIVHSKLSKNERDKNLNDWRYGDVINFCVSVNILVEGFDMPELSCLIMCRPTKSPVIWVQAIGRILRTYGGKKSALLIDMVGNIKEFGLDLDNPKFIIPKSVDGDGDGDAVTKICPGIHKDGSSCGSELYAAVLVCPYCGYKFNAEEVQALLGDMEEVDFKQLEPPQWFDVVSFDPSIHSSKNNGKQLARLSMEVRYPDAMDFERNRYVSVWCCFEDFYDSDYAIKQGMEKWELFSDEEYPASVEEAEWHFDTLKIPKKVLCQEDDKGYLSALEFEFGGEITEPIKLEDIPF